MNELNLEPIKEVFPTIYKRDSKGKIRVWAMELDGERHRTIAGLADGKLVTSKWTTCTPKNIGKKNETSAEEQAVLEIEAMYKKKLSVDYHESEDDVDEFKTFKPMLADKWENRKDSLDWTTLVDVVVQPKLDGIRCIATKSGLFTRTGKPIVSAPHVERELEPFFEKHPKHVLDGELYNHLLKEDFNKIVSLVRTVKLSEDDLIETERLVEYHIYDIAQGVEAPYLEREEFLRMELEDPDNMIITRESSLFLVPHTKVDSEQACDDTHTILIKNGYEGSMIRMNSMYEKGKRSKALLKRKDFIDEEFIVLGYVEGKGNWAGLPKTIELQLPNGIVGEATMKGSREYLQEVKDNFHKYLGKEATVKHFGFTLDGKLRHGNVKVLHEKPRI